VSASTDERRSELSPRVARAIDRERGRLGRAAAVLRCLLVASMYDDEIDVTEVAEAACRLVNKAIDRLDIVELCRIAKKGATASTHVLTKKSHES
jgi:hypothetical protein